MTTPFRTVREIMQELRDEGGQTVDQQLEMLIDKFCLAVRAIDPEINNIWVGREGDDLRQPFFIHLERRESRFARRSGR